MAALKLALWLLREIPTLAATSLWWIIYPNRHHDTSCKSEIGYQDPDRMLLVAKTIQFPD